MAQFILENMETILFLLLLLLGILIVVQQSEKIVAFVSPELALKRALHRELLNRTQTGSAVVRPTQGLEQLRATRDVAIAAYEQATQSGAPESELEVLKRRRTEAEERFMRESHRAAHLEVAGGEVQSLRDAFLERPEPGLSVVCSADFPLALSPRVKLLVNAQVRRYAYLLGAIAGGTLFFAGFSIEKLVESQVKAEVIDRSREAREAAVAAANRARDTAIASVTSLSAETKKAKKEALASLSASMVAARESKEDAAEARRLVNTEIKTVKQRVESVSKKADRAASLIEKASQDVDSISSISKAAIDEATRLKGAVEDLKKIVRELRSQESVRKEEKARSADVPVGAVAAWAAEAPPPENWLPCDGRAINPGKYPRLAKVLGATYSKEGDPVLWSRLPDYRGYFLRGLDTSGDSPARDPAVGRKLGSLQTDAFAKHQHPVGAQGNHTHRIEASGAHEHPLEGELHGAGNGPTRVNAVPLARVQQLGRTVPGTGAHSHPVQATGAHSHSSTEVGGDETRPRNVSVQWIIYAGKHGR